MLPKSDTAWRRCRESASRRAVGLAAYSCNSLQNNHLRQRKSKKGLCAPCAFLSPSNSRRLLAFQREVLILSKVAPRNSRRPSVRHDHDACGNDSADIHSHADDAFDAFRDDEFDAHGEFDDEMESDLEAEYDVDHTGNDDQIDDPIRIYLMQMGDIPMLNRKKEIDVAKRISAAAAVSAIAAGHRLHPSRRRRPAGKHSRRPASLGSDDRSVGDEHCRKKAAVEGIEAEFRTLHHLMLQNKADFALAVDRRQPIRGGTRSGGGCSIGGSRRCGWSRKWAFARNVSAALEQSSAISSAWTPSAGNWPRPAATKTTWPTPPSFARSFAA